MWYLIIGASALQIIGMIIVWHKVVRDLSDNPWWWRLGLLLLWPITLFFSNFSVE